MARVNAGYARRFVDNGKAIVHVRPFKPEPFGRALMNMLRNILFHEDEWRKAYRGNEYAALPRLNLAKQFFNFIKLSGLLFAKHFGKRIALASAGIGGPTIDARKALINSFYD